MFEHRHFSRRIQWCTIIFLFEYAYHIQTRPNPNDWVGQVTTKSAKNWVTITRQGHACILLYQILNDYIHLYSLSILSIYIYYLYVHIPIIYNILSHMAHILFQPGILCYSPQCDLCQDPKVLTNTPNESRCPALATEDVCCDSYSWAFDDHINRYWIHIW
jgi:hypothetical protein